MRGGRNLRAIRLTWLGEDRMAPARLLEELALDPRPGARTLGRTLARRRELRRAEETRIETLLNFERLLWKAGAKHVAGVDEVGVGPLAGPVVAAAVVLPHDIDLLGVDDSKRLDGEERERLEAGIRARAVAVSVAEVEVEELDRINVYRAGLEAMRRAVLGLAVRPDHVLVDAREVPGLAGIPQNAFEKGDGLNYSIAAASIVAKVHRDRRMTALAAAYPGYGFEQHKGYGTAAHMAALRRLGPCPIHRRSFPVLDQAAGAASELFYALRQEVESAATLAAIEAAARRMKDARSALAAAEGKKLAVLLARRRRRLAAGAR